MRTPRRRQLRRGFDQTSTPEQRNGAAARAVYEGSPEHKTAFTWLAEIRSDATPCPRNLKDRSVLTEWVRDAIRQGHCSDYWDGDFPKYVRVRRDAIVYEGRLINREQGTYKGYPLDPSEHPSELP